MSDHGDRTFYRLCWIDVLGRILAIADPFRAPSDAVAIHIAAAMAEGDRVELWLGGRLVAELGSEPSFRTLH